MGYNDYFFNRSKRERGRVKHQILNYYLQGYFEALSPRNKRLIYIDGFAGPGLYRMEDGSTEDGSPLVAYKTAVHHFRIEEFHQILLVFIETDETYAEELRQHLTNYKSTIPDSENKEKVQTVVINGKFKDVMNDTIGQPTHGEDPMLIFIDPFGLKGYPMSLMKSLANRPKTELIINVMYSSMSQYYCSPLIQSTLNEFFGEEDSNWKTNVFKDQTPKSEAFVDYYLSKLIGPKHYHHIFAMKDNHNQDIYQFIFITHYVRGMITMERAMERSSQDSHRFVYSELEECQPMGQPIHRIETQIFNDMNRRLFAEREGLIFGKEFPDLVWPTTPPIMRCGQQLRRPFSGPIHPNHSYTDFDFNFDLDIYFNSTVFNLSR